MLQKFTIYFTNRFPLLPLLLYTTVTALSINSAFYSIDWKKTFIISLVYLMFLFHLRILDEFKDYYYDTRYHTDRPIQQGFMSLSILRKVGMMNLFFLFFLAFFVSNLKQAAFLILAIFYTIFMFKEFFIPKFLSKHVLIYLFSHEIVFIPLFLFFYSVFYKAIWIPITFADFALLFYTISPIILIEIGRKIKHRYDKKGKKTDDTYAYIWGQENSLRVFSFMLGLVGVLSIFIPGFNNLLSGVILFITLILFSGSFIYPKYLIGKSMAVTTICALLLPSFLIYSFL